LAVKKRKGSQHGGLQEEMRPGAQKGGGKLKQGFPPSTYKMARETPTQGKWRDISVKKRRKETKARERGSLDSSREKKGREKKPRKESKGARLS